MRNNSYPFAALFVVLTLAGCGTDASKGKNSSAGPDAAEQAVRKVISEHLKIDSSAIPMDRPISAPPLKADDLDLVELILELEERQGISISDDEVGTVQITPNQLISIVRDASKSQKAK